MMLKITLLILIDIEKSTYKYDAHKSRYCTLIEQFHLPAGKITFKKEI